MVGEVQNGSFEAKWQSFPQEAYQALLKYVHGLTNTPRHPYNLGHSGREEVQRLTKASLKETELLDHVQANHRRAIIGHLLDLPDVGIKQPLLPGTDSR